MSEGLKGYEKRTKELKAALDFTKPESIDKNVFYKAVLIVIEAVHNFAERYSKLAKDMALTETDAKRKEELLEISKICAKFHMNLLLLSVRQYSLSGLFS